MRLALKSRFADRRRSVLIDLFMIQSSGHGIFHFKSQGQSHLWQELAFGLNLPKNRAEWLIALGAVYVNNQRTLESELPILTQTTIRVHTSPRRFPNPGKIQVLEENEDFIIVDKPHGIPVHPTVDNIKENLQYYLQKQIQSRVYVTHRLDTATGGILLYAKNNDFLSAFNKCLSERQVQKIYQCQTQGPILSPQILTHYMESSPRAPKVVHKQTFETGILCQLEILESIANPDGVNSYTIRLITGRTHQIRSQLGFEKNPILGDLAYGSKISLPAASIALKSTEMSFEHKNQTVQVAISGYIKT